MPRSRLAAGLPLREIILLSYGALTMMTVQLDPANSAGVLNPAAADWFQRNPQLIPLSREPFLQPVEVETMIAVSVPHPTPLPDPWVCALASRGFASAGDVLPAGEMAARAAGSWLVLETTAMTRKTGQRQAELERPGLWKRVGCDPHSRFVFEFPAAVVCPNLEIEEGDETGSTLSEALLDCALASANNEIPPGWQPPAKELVASWMRQTP